MATITLVNKYPKTVFSPEQVEHLRQANLAANAVSSTLSETDKYYILTTIWNRIEGPL